MGDQQLDSDPIQLLQPPKLNTPPDWLIDTAALYKAIDEWEAIRFEDPTRCLDILRAEYEIAKRSGAVLAESAISTIIADCYGRNGEFTQSMAWAKAAEHELKNHRHSPALKVERDLVHLMIFILYVEVVLPFLVFQYRNIHQVF